MAGGKNCILPLIQLHLVYPRTKLLFLVFVRETAASVVLGLEARNPCHLSRLGLHNSVGGVFNCGLNGRSRVMTGVSAVAFQRWLMAGLLHRNRQINSQEKTAAGARVHFLGDCGPVFFTTANQNFPCPAQRPITVSAFCNMTNVRVLHNVQSKIPAFCPTANQNGRRAATWDVVFRLWWGHGVLVAFLHGGGR